MLKIGEFSKVAKTTVKTLRYYDEVGLFKPSFVDENGYRYYEEDRLEELLRIIDLRSLDLPIESIDAILKGTDEKYILMKHLRSLEDERDRKSLQIASLNRILKGERKMSFKSEIKVIESNVVYYRKGVIAEYSALGDFVWETGQICGKLNPTLKCKPYCYVTYTAMEYKEKDVELEYAEAVEEAGIEGDGIFFRVDPSIKALCVEVKGSYSNLGKGYEFALKEARESGFTVIGPIREVYIHGCWDSESEDDYLTEIQVPVK